MSDTPPPIENEESKPAEKRIKQFPCGQCGAKLEFKPGLSALQCPYCGHESAIPQSEEDIVELDYHTQLAELAQTQETEEHTFVKCDGCGADVDKPEKVDAFPCPYCDHNIVATEHSARLIKPKSVLPFKVTRKKARAAFQDWIKGLWFAPNKLKQYARADNRLNGLYVPYWTYDSDTTSFYRGERGEDYWDTEWYTDSEGKQKSRQVRKTRWYPCSGTVWVDFDDVLVLASTSLPKKYAVRLEPWDLDNLEPYSHEYLSGFTAEAYHVDLGEGFDEAKDIMADGIRREIKRDIGGDHQRIHSVRSRYDNVTFKHILLPIWMSAYRYQGKVYRFLVNARSGEVQGERPWSWVKIAFAVLTALIIIGIIAFFANN